MASKNKLILSSNNSNNNNTHYYDIIVSGYTKLTDIIDCIELQSTDHPHQYSYQYNAVDNNSNNTQLTMQQAYSNLSSNHTRTNNTTLVEHNDSESNINESLTSPLQSNRNNTSDNRNGININDSESVNDNLINADENNDNIQSLKSLFNRRLLYLILFGQILSLLITGTGVFSELLANNNVNIPTSQSFFNYFCLSLLNIVLIKRYYNKRTAYKLLNNPINNNQIANSNNIAPSYISIPWYKYFFLSICDVEGNYFLVRAYQYTSITSVQLLDCFTIPLVMILSYCILKTRYTKQHIIGAIICCIGLILLITTDLLSHRYDNDNNNSTGYNAFIGDLLVLCGCVFYAISNIGQEYIVKQYDSIEYLSMIGLFGSIVSAIQMSILERDALNNVDWSNWIIILYLILFSLCLLFLYIFTPLLLQNSSAIFMNLSYLTSDFWSILIAIFIFHAYLHPLYFIAFAIIICGLLIYNLAANNYNFRYLLRAACNCCAIS